MTTNRGGSREETLASPGTESEPRNFAAGVLIAGRYRLEAELGSGGMGTVWAATHAVTRRRVALKIVGTNGLERGSLEKVVREARAACAASHPSLCPVHDVLEVGEGSAALVMDLLEGRTVRALLDERRVLGARETATLFAQIVSGVGAAHAAGVLHRDLKPSNLFVERDGRARVLDFGIAKLELPGEWATDSTNPGTPPYMAPEQLLGDKTFDVRVDVWSLGVILYECLAGECPTTVGAENPGQVLRNVLERPIPPLRRLAPEVPADLAELVDRMLRRRADERPPHLIPVLEVLRRHTAIEVPDIEAERAPPPVEAASGAITGAATIDLPPRAAGALPASLPGSRAGALPFGAAAFLGLGILASLAARTWDADEAHPVGARVETTASGGTPAPDAEPAPGDGRANRSDVAALPELPTQGRVSPSASAATPRSKPPRPTSGPSPNAAGRPPVSASTSPAPPPPPRPSADPLGDPW